MNKRVLLLNNDYTPIKTISYKKALVLSFKENIIKIVSYYNEHILDTKGRQHMIPAVVILNKYVKLSRKEVPFSRRNVFCFAKFCCAYCGQKFESSSLSIDHVIPISIWNKQNHSGRSPTNFENCVCCCLKCNRKKANRTPQEARMPLLYEPRKPKYGEVVSGIQLLEDTPDEWRPYLKKLKV